MPTDCFEKMQNASEGLSAVVANMEKQAEYFKRDLPKLSQDFTLMAAIVLRSQVDMMTAFNELNQFRSDQVDSLIELTKQSNEMVIRLLAKQGINA